MRIGTWNLQGRWDERHRDRIAIMDCDILLLTEVSERVDLPGHHVHATSTAMAPGRRWAAVAAREPFNVLKEPHGASAMVGLNGLRICSSILPWRTCGTQAPWTGATTAAKTESAVAAIRAAVPTIWGGDWNHALSGREWVGSMQGRSAIVESFGALKLQVPTACLAHQIPGLLTIDHIAVPVSWEVLRTEHHRAVVADMNISDHDAYVVEVDTTTRPDRS